MAYRVRLDGTEFPAKFLNTLSNGNVLVEALAHGPRFVPGTHVEVCACDVISTDVPEPAHTDMAASAAALQAAMDEERKTLTPVAELIKQGGEIAHDAPDKLVTAQTPNKLAAQQDAAIRPTQPPKAAAKNPNEDEMSDRLSEKLKLAASAAAEITGAVEKRADALIARKAALLQRQEQVFSMHEKVMNDAEAGLDSVEAALRQLSNSVPGQA